jgi:hypothetical protein
VSNENVVLRTGAELAGRAFAPQGGIRLEETTITRPACETPSEQTTTSTTDPSATTTTTPSGTTPTTAGTGGTGDGTGGTGDGTGSGDGSGGDPLATTGAYTLAASAAAAVSLMLGHVLVGTERVVEWNARRWRPRHALPRFPRLHRAAAVIRRRVDRSSV